ncbi:DUF2971 domain-containing protein [Moritella viscosa]|uniref:DUF2971 domain-containing protein n=1 Tax=Moritella viscosa TaxID=80854 RepID=UPI00091B535C|nr:DUF2971 domain-containing protein [Moritella viscosa]SGY86524.1 Putative uncharacterized protein [Moritella viscosa]
MDRIIHHYTSIETLALILKTKHVRFNRLDRVDDATENDSFARLKMGEFFFVSCWTTKDRESIPQWNMYTPNMSGVRISIPERMFNYKPLKAPGYLNSQSKGEFLSPIPFDKWSSDEYFIMPGFTKHEWFSREVQYRDDYKEEKNKGIEVVWENEKIVNLKLNTPSRLAALKSTDWAFQDEFRFVLMIFPNSTAIRCNNSYEQFHQEIIGNIASSLESGQGSNINYYDMELNPKIFDDMTVTLGPLCSYSDKIIVHALLEKFASKAKVIDSKLTGTIRVPSRK